MICVPPHPTRQQQRRSSVTESTIVQTPRPILVSGALRVSLCLYGAPCNRRLFQGLGEATMKEFKRHKKLTPTKTPVATPDPSSEDTPSITARLGTFLEKKRSAVLGPSKISTAECRGQRPYQASGWTLYSLRLVARVGWSVCRLVLWLLPHWGTALSELVPNSVRL